MINAFSLPLLMEHKPKTTPIKFTFKLKTAQGVHEWIMLGITWMAIKRQNEPENKLNFKVLLKQQKSLKSSG